MPRLFVDLSKIEHNARIISDKAREYGVGIYGVGKGLAGRPPVAGALLAGGCVGIGDARLENIRVMRDAGIESDFMLLRLPQISRAKETVELCDISLNSEVETLRSLSLYASARSKVHKVLLMVDLGDLREGVWPDGLQNLIRTAAKLPGLKVWGIGTNLTCYGGVIPDSRNMSHLIALAAEAEDTLGHKVEVSGGNSGILSMLFSGQLPAGVTHLRIGEGILLGREALNRQPLPGAFTDTCRLEAEVIELQVKPSVPLGALGQDAFGEYPKFVDRGMRQRAILAIGRQDVSIDGLTPLLPGAIVLGGSSDHLIMDVEEAAEINVGDKMSFMPGYGAMLALATSNYVETVFTD
ncbi:MAG TPA: alanine/ornithine racemase family PLP-dependent enzyme [Bacillota bacterium]|nr:alanine/ornithine racemase family PLP-dependent enzyme [Bacillota bacterium]